MRRAQLDSTAKVPDNGSSLPARDLLDEEPAVGLRQQLGRGRLPRQRARDGSSAASAPGAGCRAAPRRAAAPPSALGPEAVRERLLDTARRAGATGAVPARLRRRSVAARPRARSRGRRANRATGSPSSTPIAAAGLPVSARLSASSACATTSCSSTAAAAGASTTTRQPGSGGGASRARKRCHERARDRRRPPVVRSVHSVP